MRSPKGPRYCGLVAAAATAAAGVVSCAAAAVAAAAEQNEKDNDYPDAAVISVAEHSIDLSPHKKFRGRYPVRRTF